MKKRSMLVIATVFLLAMAFLFPVYGQSLSGFMQQDRTQTCIPDGSATRAYGDESPMQAQVEKPETITEETVEESESPIHEQTQTQEQLQECECENVECEEYQYQHGQEETFEESETLIQEQTQTQEQLQECDNEDCQEYQYQHEQGKEQQ
jgi:hypothetical protein